MGAYRNFIQRAVLLIVAVITALGDAAFDAFVCFTVVHDD